jgi:DNA-binding response OmpR family regulator
VLSSVLDLQGYQVVCTSNGQEALDWLEETWQTDLRPAIILLDLFMPVMNGADFLVGMRERWPEAETVPPVILFTVDEGNHDDLACAEVLPKPFHIRDLLAKFRLVLGNEQKSA